MAGPVVFHPEQTTRYAAEPFSSLCKEGLNKCFREPFAHSVTIIAFFLIRTDLISLIFITQKLHVASEFATQKAIVAVAFKSLPAVLIGNAVVVALPLKC
jgi:hypothetical protein